MKHKPTNNSSDCWVIVENLEDLLTINKDFFVEHLRIINESIKSSKKPHLAASQQQSFLSSGKSQFYKSKIKDQIL